jgi:hypothetical protein
VNALLRSRPGMTAEREARAGQQVHALQHIISTMKFSSSMIAEK